MVAKASRRKKNETACTHTTHTRRCSHLFHNVLCFAFGPLVSHGSSEKGTKERRSRAHRSGWVLWCTYARPVLCNQVRRTSRSCTLSSISSHASQKHHTTQYILHLGGGFHIVQRCGRHFQLTSPARVVTAPFAAAKEQPYVTF